MVPERAVDPEAVSLTALYGAKTRAELDGADALLPGVLRVRRGGDPDARILLVKGRPGAGDLEAGEALAGPDGEAVRLALDALARPGTFLGIVSRAVPGIGAEAASARVARYLEALDPAEAIALDEVAAADLANAAGVRALPFGEPVLVRGRRLLAVDGLEASLTDEARKALVWRQFKGLGAQEGRP